MNVFGIVFEKSRTLVLLNRFDDICGVVCERFWLFGNSIDGENMSDSVRFGVLGGNRARGMKDRDCVTLKAGSSDEETKSPLIVSDEAVMK
jgi:hypothetical protein